MPSYRDANTFLKNRPHWVSRIEELRVEIPLLENDDFLSAVVPNDMPRANTHFDLGFYVQQRDLRVAERKRRLQALVERVRRCDDIIDAAPKRELQQALHGKYVEGRTWAELAQALNASGGTALRQRCMGYLNSVNRDMLYFDP